MAREKTKATYYALGIIAIGSLLYYFNDARIKDSLSQLENFVVISLSVFGIYQYFKFRDFAPKLILDHKIQVVEESESQVLIFIEIIVNNLSKILVKEEILGTIRCQIHPIVKGRKVGAVIDYEYKDFKKLVRNQMAYFPTQIEPSESDTIFLYVKLDNSNVCFELHSEISNETKEIKQERELSWQKTTVHNLTPLINLNPKAAQKKG